MNKKKVFTELLNKFWKKKGVKKGMVEIDLRALYEKYGSELYECYIVHIPKWKDGLYDYYELYDYDDKFICMDKEQCVVTSTNFWSGSKTLKCLNEEHGRMFKLTATEFECATRNNLKEPKQDYCYDDDFDIWLQAI